MNGFLVGFNPCLSIGPHLDMDKLTKPQFSFVKYSYNGIGLELWDVKVNL